MLEGLPILILRPGASCAICGSKHPTTEIENQLLCRSCLASKLVQQYLRLQKQVEVRLSEIDF
jgi:hypothetical protein